ncbi:PqiC family protein [Marinobacter sp. SS21]|uniref:PqiC family protein n=1 Tax=Marinobacter sp. SS21 TaxID=2979460 RepID=UPI00232B1EAF|nr:ABC-type transport auxiliary lipoprotein family protein [Marinobacter sp. SS21]MDC0661455.1 ABC-type transport auxiliary lipoprotein family protein [Marinobacter sp. SS21]
MMNLKHLFVVCSLAILLAACASAPSPPPPGYLLPSAAMSGHGAMAVQVRLAGYLEQGGLVLQLSKSELHSARQHRWAESLAQQLQRGLHAHLGEQAGTEKGQLLVRLSQFHGVRDAQGDRAVIRGAWQFQAADGPPRQGTIDWHEPIATDGYAALVESLDLGWRDVARQIASALQ